MYSEKGMAKKAQKPVYTGIAENGTLDKLTVVYEGVC